MSVAGRSFWQGYGRRETPGTFTSYRWASNGFDEPADTPVVREPRCRDAHEATMSISIIIPYSEYRFKRSEYELGIQLMRRMGALY